MASFAELATKYTLVIWKVPVGHTSYRAEKAVAIECDDCGKRVGNLDSIPHQKDWSQCFAHSDWYRDQVTV